MPPDHDPVRGEVHLEQDLERSSEIADMEKQPVLRFRRADSRFFFALRRLPFRKTERPEDLLLPVLRADGIAQDLDLVGSERIVVLEAVTSEPAFLRFGSRDFGRRELRRGHSVRLIST